MRATRFTAHVLIFSYCFVCTAQSSQAWFLFHKHRAPSAETSNTSASRQDTGNNRPPAAAGTSGINQTSPCVTRPYVTAPNYGQSLVRPPVGRTRGETNFPPGYYRPDEALLTPTAPDVMPPDLPPRPPVQALLGPPQSVISAGAPAHVLSADERMASMPPPVKPPLAWRAKALRIETAADRSTARVFDCNPDDAMMALLSALPANGLRVDVLDSKGGELLAAPSNPKARQRYIFVVSELEPGRVAVKGSPQWASKGADDLSASVLRSIAPSEQRRGSL